MSDRSRQLLLLGVLVVALVWMVSRQLAPEAGGAARPAPRRAVGDGTVAAPDGPIEVAELRLEALEHKPASYAPGRDPFRFAPKAAPRPKRAKRKRKPQPPARQPQREPRPAQPAPPQPPPIEFVYLGSFGVPGREIAVFSDGKEILNAFAGDVLQREFVVRNIGFESADIGFVNFPDVPAKRLAVGG